MSFFNIQVKCYDGFPGAKEEDKNNGFVTYRIITNFGTEVLSIEFVNKQEYDNYSCNGICYNFEKAFRKLLSAGFKQMAKDVEYGGY